MDRQTNREFLPAVAALGCTSIVTQTILLREFLSVFSGNELIIGIVLADWMVLTGTGSFLGHLGPGSRQWRPFVTTLAVCIAVLPLMSAFLLSWLKSIVFPAGTMVGIWESLYGSFLLLAPYCLVSGFMFTRFVLLLPEEGRMSGIAKVYALEAIGSVIGGLIFNLALVFFLTTFQSLFLLALVNLTALFLILRKHGAVPARAGVIILGAALCIIMVAGDLDTMCRQFLFKGQVLLFHHDTPYGNISVTRQGEQLNFYENAALLFSTNDATANEEAVHYGMVQHPDPRSVLLISGGISGTIQEVLKYNVDRVDDVEINPALIDAGRRFTSMPSDSRIHIFNEDARRFVRTTDERFDVVLVNVPDPGTAQVNRYFTVEFLRDVKARLSPGGVISLSVLPSVDYYGGEARMVNSIVYNTLKSAFSNVLIIPGLRNFYLASDSGLHLDVARMVAQRHIPTTYVNPFYIDDESLRDRSRDITKNIDGGTVLNRDFAPVAYYRQVLYWLMYFRVNPWFIGAGVIAILIVIGVRLNTITLGMFTGGFAASSIEVLLLLAFQTMYGYVYQATGLIITIFMAGLAAGSLSGRNPGKRRAIGEYITVQVLIGIYAVLLPLVFSLVNNAGMGESVVYGIFGLLTFTIAALIGREFTLAAKLLKGSERYVSSELYGVDLFGSALGALVISLYVVPVFGIERASFVVAFLSFASAIVGIVQRRHFGIASVEGLSYV